MPDFRPIGIVAGFGDVVVDEVDLRGVTVLAAGAVAFMATIGNNDPELTMRSLHAVAAEHGKLAPRSTQTLSLLADEIIEAAQKEKSFMLVGRATLEPKGEGEQEPPTITIGPDAERVLQLEALLQKIAEEAYGENGELLTVCDLLREAGIGRSS